MSQPSGPRVLLPFAAVVPESIYESSSEHGPQGAWLLSMGGWAGSFCQQPSFKSASFQILFGLKKFTND